MKKPEEYIQDAIDNIYECDQPYFDNEVTCVYDGNSEAIFQAIKQAQIEAWNEALDKAAEESVVEVVDHEEFIVKTFETYDGNSIILPVYGVDEDSILNLKII